MAIPSCWRRQPNGADDPAGALTSQVSRGFTGHEMLDELDLVHMNGRIYDPQLGRFLSADPYVQHPGSTQGWNRYAYVDNNPLSLTDPTGYWGIKSFFRGVRSVVRNPYVRTAAAIVAAYYLGPQSSSALFGTSASATITVGSATTAGLANAAVAGTVAGGIATGTVKGALMGGVTAMAFYGVGSLTDGHLQEGLFGGNLPPSNT